MLKNRLDSRGAFGLRGSEADRATLDAGHTNHDLVNEGNSRIQLDNLMDKSDDYSL